MERVQICDGGSGGVGAVWSGFGGRAESGGGLGEPCGADVGPFRPCECGRGRREVTVGRGWWAQGLEGAVLSNARPGHQRRAVVAES
eukprot:835914-Rhodomonas_salina.2